MPSIADAIRISSFQGSSSSSSDPSSSDPSAAAAAHTHTTSSIHTEHADAVESTLRARGGEGERAGMGVSMDGSIPAPLLSQLPVLLSDREHTEAHFPTGAVDVNGQQVGCFEATLMCLYSVVPSYPNARLWAVIYD